MATKKTTAETATKKIADSANDYIERLAKGHDKLTESVQTARERNARIADKIFESVVAGQRDALDVTKKIVSEPTAYGKNMETMVNSMTAAQERTMDVVKAIYREQSEAAAEMRGYFENTFEGGKVFTQPFEKMQEMWAAAAK